jgi:hypothetical protein
MWINYLKATQQEDGKARSPTLANWDAPAHDSTLYP